jgi:copper transport protein
MRISRSGVIRMCLVALLSVLALVFASGTASAHAQLEDSDPPAGEVLPTAPHQVTLTFGEPVEVAAGSVQVFDDHFNRVDDQVEPTDPQRNQIQVGLNDGLAAGTYTVSWKVSSADTHPASGTFRFSIGAPIEVSGAVPGVGHNDAAGALLGLLRGLGYGGLVLGSGLLLVVLALWPTGLGDRCTRRLMWTGLGLLGSSTIGEMVLQDVWASGVPLSAIWSAPSTSDTHSQRFDTLHAVRFYLLVAFAVALAAVMSASGTQPVGKRRRGRSPRPRRHGRLLLGVTVAFTVALMATWSLAGRAAAGQWTPLAVTSALLRLFAMSVWFDGLALVAVSLSPAARATDLAQVLPRFSTLAFTSVVVLVVTGAFQSWRQVGSLAALPTTTFGRVLLAKLCGVVLLVALGNLARRRVQRDVAAPEPITAPPKPRVVSRGGAAVLERVEATTDAHSRPPDVRHCAAACSPNSSSVPRCSGSPRRSSRPSPRGRPTSSRSSTPSPPTGCGCR